MFNCTYAKHINGSLHSPHDLPLLLDSPLPMELKLCQKELPLGPTLLTVARNILQINIKNIKESVSKLKYD